MSMKIQKGMVTYKDRDNIPLNYGEVETENGVVQYYFLDGGQLVNDNLIVTTALIEAVDSQAMASHIGVITQDGDIIIPCENKNVKSITDTVLLVEKTQPTTDTVIEAVKLRSDPLAATRLVTTPAAIKEKMSASMGEDGKYVFNDQFSEASIYDIDGRNLIHDESYSFIGVTEDKIFFSKNTPESEIIVKPLDIDAMKEEELAQASAPVAPVEEASAPVEETPVETEVVTEEVAPVEGEVVPEETVTPTEIEEAINTQVEAQEEDKPYEVQEGIAPTVETEVVYEEQPEEDVYTEEVSEEVANMSMETPVEETVVETPVETEVVAEEVPTEVVETPTEEVTPVEVEQPEEVVEASVEENVNSGFDLNDLPADEVTPVEAPVAEEVTEEIVEEETPVEEPIEVPEPEVSREEVVVAPEVESEEEVEFTIPEFEEETAVENIVTPEEVEEVVSEKIPSADDFEVEDNSFDTDVDFSIPETDVYEEYEETTNAGSIMADVTETISNLVELNRNQQVMIEEYKDKENKYKDTLEKAKAAHTKLTATVKTQTEQISSLNERVHSLTRDNENLERKNESLTKENSKLKAKVDELTLTSNDSLNRALADAQSLLDNFKNN